MEKVQILFPEPMLASLRQLAQKQDRTLSDVIRGAAERYIGMFSTNVVPTSKKSKWPSVKGGVLIDAAQMRDFIYDDE
jgi:hypothetical protein